MTKPAEAGTTVEDTLATIGPGKTLLSSSALERFTLSSSEIESLGIAVTPPPPSVGFDLKRLIGKGGLGEVWLAVQHSLGRVVAVKRIQQRLFADELLPQQRSAKLRSFRQEALITAQLDHPGILPVYDLTTSSDGVPLLAMKLVDGTPWDRALVADFSTLDHHEYLTKHLAIFVQVAQAVAFAHSRGIVHRDLKPGQVMLGRFGEVLLMDWGLSVFVGGETADGEIPIPESVASQLPNPSTASSPAGTPAMMAPEQTLRSASEVTRATDIFLLGGTLYYILTSTPPHNGPTIARVLLQAAACRIEHPEERAPGRLCPPTLAAAALKAMAPDPADRLPSVDALIAAVQDYLSGAGSRRESTQLCERTRKQLNELWTLPGAPNAEVLYRGYSECLNYVDRATALWPQNPELEGLRDRVLSAYGKAALGSNDLTLAAALASRIDDTELGGSITREANLRAEKQRQQSRQRVRALAAALCLLLLLVAGSVKYSRDQKAAAERAGRARDDAEREMNFMLGSLSTDLTRLGHLPLLESVAMEAVSHFERVPEEDITPATLGAHAIALRQLGEVRFAQGRAEDARLAFASALRIRRESLRRANSDDQRFELSLDYFAIADVAKRQGLFDEALGYYDRSREIQQGLLRKKPGTKNWLLALSDTEGQVGSIQLARGSTEEARRTFLRQLAQREELAAQYRDDTEVLSRLATSNIQIGWTLRSEGRIDEYMERLRAAIGIRTRIYEGEPGSYEARASLARSWYELGAAQRDQSMVAEALEAIGRAIELTRELAAREGGNTQWRADHALYLQASGILMIQRQIDVERGRRQLEEALAMQNRLVETDPTNVAWQSDRAATLMSLGTLKHREGRIDTALVHYLQASRIRRALVARTPSNQLWQSQLAASTGLVADALANLKCYEEAESYAYESLTISSDLYAASPGAPMVSSNLLTAYSRAASVATELGQFEPALSMLECAWLLEPEVAAESEDEVDYFEGMVSDIVTRAKCLIGLGFYPQAASLLESVTPAQFPPPTAGAERRGQLRDLYAKVYFQLARGQALVGSYPEAAESLRFANACGAAPDWLRPEDPAYAILQREQPQALNEFLTAH